MIRKIIICFALFQLITPTVSAGENSPLYLGLNGAKFDSKYNDTFEPNGGMFSLGWDMNNYIALEVAAGASETVEDVATSSTSKVDYVASAFLRFNLRFNRVTVYVLGGYSKAKTTSTTGATTIEAETDGGSYGYGVDFYGTRDLALSLRRVEFFDINNDNEQVHLGATMVGLTYYYDTPKIHSRY